MNPKKVTIESEANERRKALCDEIIGRAALMMVDEVEAPIPMMLDRILTYAGAQACKMDGSAATAMAFREFATKIDAGLFHSITGEGKQGH